MERTIIKRLIPKPLRVTNAEKLSHVDELTLLQDQRKNISHPLTVMHGHKDRIVPIENAYFLETHAIQADLDMRIYEERDHFLPFSRAYAVEQAINDMSTKTSSLQ
jgi:esterase/lipase